MILEHHHNTPALPIIPLIVDDFGNLVSLNDIVSPVNHPFNAAVHFVRN